MTHPFVKILFALPLLLLDTRECLGQDPKNITHIQVSVNTIMAAMRSTVEFKTDKAEDVLIILTDSAGQTTFLENLHMYKGAYRREIGLPAKGKYQLQVIRDNEKITRTVEIK